MMIPERVLDVLGAPASGEVTDVAQDPYAQLFVIERADSKPDGMGREMFFAYWWSSAYKPNHVGPHVRGQAFRAVPDDFAARMVDGGRAVVTLVH